MASEPICTEVTCSASVGGKVQIVKFEYSADYHFSMSRKYSVPEEWSEEDVHAFQKDKTLELRGHLEEIDEDEMIALMKQRDGEE